MLFTVDYCTMDREQYDGVKPHSANYGFVAHVNLDTPADIEAFLNGLDSWDAPYVDEAFSDLEIWSGVQMDDYRPDGWFDRDAFLAAVNAKLGTRIEF